MAPSAAGKDEGSGDVKPYPRKLDEPVPDRRQFERETVEYFERRRERLRVVATTVTPSGQTLDWIPIESQMPGGKIASLPPPPTEPPELDVTSRGKMKETLSVPEL